MSSIVILAGRRIAEVSWPAYSRSKGGTCDFMTEQCKKHCIVTTNEIEEGSLKFFRDNHIMRIVRELIEGIGKLEASILCWFIGSGDCPKGMTDKVFRVMDVLNDMDVIQHGFTRNEELWRRTFDLRKCTMILTVEKDEDIPYSAKGALVAEPNYEKDVVKIYRIGERWQCSWGCGGGWVHPTKTSKYIPKTTVEDCSLCLENNNGCFTLEKKNGQVKKKKTKKVKA